MTRKSKSLVTLPVKSTRVRRRRRMVPPAKPVRDTTLDADPAAGQLITRVEAIFSALGSKSIVLVEVTTKPGVLAQVIGGTVFSFATGTITIGRDLLNLLSWDEMKFVLAHEAAHIHHNHIIARAPAAIFRSMLDEDARDDPTLRALLRIYDLSKLIDANKGKLPADAAMLRRNELEADSTALALTRNKAAAESCLRRLVGDDLDAPSHTWEVFDGRFTRPALTMRERLAALRAVPESWW